MAGEPAEDRSLLKPEALDDVRAANETAASRFQPILLFAQELAGMSGGKSLNIYYVAENVRDKNISCVMSFWNNDDINPETKLPALLEKIIILK